jgi:diacylglycerol kinase family enzyme
MPSRPGALIYSHCTETDSGDSVDGWLDTAIETSPGAPTIGLYLNAAAQGASTERIGEIRDTLAGRLPEGTDLVDYSTSNDPMVQTLRAAARRSALLVVGGGDGTVAAAVEALRDTDCRLAIVPLGTMNVFARDLGLPPDVDGALDVILKGAPAQVDHGEVNGRVFLNGVLLGSFSDLAEERERLRGVGIGTAFDVVRRALSTFLEARAHRYRLASLERNIRLRSRVVAVMNNPLSDEPGDPFARQTLTAGALDVYASRDPSLFALPKLLMRMIFGRLRTDTRLERWATRELRIVSRRSTLKVSIDGEVETLTSPLHCVVRDGAVPVLVPQVSDRSSSAKPTGATRLTLNGAAINGGLRSAEEAA